MASSKLVDLSATAANVDSTRLMAFSNDADMELRSDEPATVGCSPSSFGVMDQSHRVLWITFGVSTVL